MNQKTTLKNVFSGTRVTIHLLLIICFTRFSVSNSSAQNIGINSIGALPDQSAILDVSAAPTNNKGLLIPRVTLISINDSITIKKPANSLIIYNTGTVLPPAGYWYNSGTSTLPVWVNLIHNQTPATAWLLSGNNNTIPSTSVLGSPISNNENFMGTKDLKDMVLGTNSFERLRITSSGSIGIGTKSPSNPLHVKASSNPVRFEGLSNGTQTDNLISIDGNGILYKIPNPSPKYSFDNANKILIAYGGTDLNYGNGDWVDLAQNDYILNSVMDLTSSYNQATGVFTVPADGFYSIDFLAPLSNFPSADPFNGEGGDYIVRLFINNMKIDGSMEKVLKGRSVGGAQVIYYSNGFKTLYLKKNDTLRLKFQTNGVDLMNSVKSKIVLEKGVGHLEIWQH